MNKIKNISLFFRILFQIVFVIIPIVLIIGWITAPDAFVALHGAFVIDMVPRNFPILHPLTFNTKLLAFLVSCIPLTFQLLILYFLIKLFRLYEQGEIFSIQNVKYIRNIGYALLIGQLVNPLYDALLSLVLTWNNPVHQGFRFTTVTIDGSNIAILLTAFFVILISWIMAEGCKLREEQQLTI